MSSPDALPIAVGAATAAGGGLLVLVRTILTFVESRRADTSYKEQLKAVQALDKDAADQLKPSDDVAFGALWSAAQSRIDAYHGIATAQARSSFLGTQIATYAGFVIVVGLGIAAAVAPTFAGSVTAATVAVVGGGLSAYIGSTFMKSQAQAIAQLRQFFNQPMEFTRLLSVERLLEGLSEVDRAAAIMKIIDRTPFGNQGLTSEK